MDEAQSKQRRHRFLNGFLVFWLLSTLWQPLFSREKFEPPAGRVIHGLGQYVSILYSDAENWQYVSEYQNGVNQVPVIYSVYASLDPALNSLDNTDFINITTQHGNPYVLLVGIALFDSTYLINGTVHIPVQDILSGALDYRIIDIAQRIKAVNGPVFVRPGFEFGWGNSGIHNDPNVSAADFVNIWIHLYNVFEQQFVRNVAWVWNTVNPNQFNYMAWYPGDQYVDWWGINYFSTSQINNADGFLSDAAAHGKPVMICESNPIHNGGTTNPANWNNWFIPYFNKIHSQAGIKAFVYISDPWDRGPFASWPDSRITSNETIRANYEAELTDSAYVHMAEFVLHSEELFGDFLPPDSVNGFTAQPGIGQIELRWQPPTNADYAGVRIMRRTDHFPGFPTDGDLVYQGTDTIFVDTVVNANTTYYYAAFAFDTIPNYADPAFASATPESTTGVENELSAAPSETLFSVFPNPFNSFARIQWELSFPADVKISVFNVTGQRVMTIIKKRLPAGKSSVSWNAERLASGIYFVTFVVNRETSQSPRSTSGNSRSTLGNRYRQVIKTLLIK